MSWFKTIYDESGRGYNCRAIEAANQAMNQYSVNDYIAIGHYEDGFVEKENLYRITDIVSGVCNGKNAIVRVPQFWIEDIETGKKQNLIDFSEYTTKTHSPTPYFNARDYPFAIPYYVSHNHYNYSMSGSSLSIRKVDNVEVKQMLESIIEKRREERRKEEEQKQKELEHARLNQSITSAQLSELISKLRNQ